MQFSTYSHPCPKRRVPIALFCLTILAGTAAPSSVAQTEGPTLSIQPAAIISWPSAANEHYVLETAATVDGPYVATFATATIRGANKEVVLPFGSEGHFFRLKVTEALTSQLAMRAGLNGTADELPEGVAVDSRNNAYLGIGSTGKIMKITPTGEMTEFATLPLAEPGGHPGILGMTFDAGRNLYVARFGQNPELTGLWKVTPAGVATRVSALEPGLPNVVTVGPGGNIFVSDSAGGKIWKVDAQGAFTVWAQDDQLKPDPTKPFPFGANGLAFDSSGQNLYVAMTQAGRIIRFPVNVDGSAGTGEVFAEDPLLGGADGITFDRHGNLYVCANRNNSIVAISPEGQLTTVAEGGLLQFPSSLQFGAGPERDTLFVANFAINQAPDLRRAGVVTLPVFPSFISMPAGFGGEGIATGRGADFYVGGRHGGGPYQGAVYKGNLITGQSQMLVAPNPARASLGLKFDARSNALFVGGGPTGAASIYDASTGEELAFFQFENTPFPAAHGVSFVNDVVITENAAYFTDSFKAQFYRVPLQANGEVPNPATHDVVPLSGDFVLGTGFNANGIAATPDGSALVIVSQGKLFRVNPDSGVAAEIEVEGGLLGGGDGILLEGNLCYITQPHPKKIEVIELDAALTQGKRVKEIFDWAFEFQTTIASYGDSIYAVNARFYSGPPTTHPATIVRVSK